MAEDALSEAFQTALETWPRDGIPENPEAWLSTAARRKLIDLARQNRRESERFSQLMAEMDRAQTCWEEASKFPDERVQMLFLCAHPAIDISVRTPLMLQVVLGLDAARISSAFLMQPAAMGQRLSRAKAKIRDAGIRFELPDLDKIHDRVEFVIDAIYVAYGRGWETVEGESRQAADLVEEAISLGSLLIEHFPDEPEALGLQALMLFCESRRATRYGSSGAYVPLSEQDPTLWSEPLIARAEAYLARAAKCGRIGRFQLEAAIQSVHANRRRVAFTDWHAVSLLYEGLMAIAPSTGAEIGRAAAVAEAQGAEAGWQLLRRVNADIACNYQPYWALAAHLLSALGRAEEARDAFDRAIGLSTDPAAREFLLARRTALYC